METCDLSESMKANLMANGVRNVTMVGTKVCGIVPFAFTIGLVFNVSQEPLETFERRYCFPSYRQALLSLEQWSQNSTAVHAPGPWIKCKGFYGDRTMDHGPRDLLVLMAQLEPKHFSPHMVSQFEPEDGFPLVIPT